MSGNSKKGPFNIMLDDAGRAELVPAKQGGGSSAASRNTLQTIQANVRTLVTRSSKIYLSAFVPNLSAATSIYIPIPFACILSRVSGSISGAPGGAAAARLTFEIGGVAVTNGELQFAIADPAGTRKDATPTANNTLLATSSLEIVVAATSTNSINAGVLLELSRS